MRNPKRKSPLISIEELNAVLGRRDLVIFDCRFSLADTHEGAMAFSLRHITGAKYLHLDDHLSGDLDDPTLGRHPLPDPHVFATLIAGLGVQSTSLVCAYDASKGAFASRLWWMLRWLGHENVVVLDGGWQGWIEAGHPTAPRNRGGEADLREDQKSSGAALSASINRTASTNSADPFRAVISEHFLISADELSSDSMTLIDSRSPQRYAGTSEPIDPVAGHIPGAINRPWMNNLDEKGLFLEKSVLRSSLLSQLGEEPTVFYCGSGVTACHNILASQVAGLGMPRLYAPSWSGWIGDPSRQIELG